jgi:hypothetical protein
VPGAVNNILAKQLLNIPSNHDRLLNRMNTFVGRLDQVVGRDGLQSPKVVLTLISLVYELKCL